MDLLPRESESHGQSGCGRRRSLGLIFAIAVTVAFGPGCASLPQRTEEHLPVVPLAEVPPAVRATVALVAQGRRLEKITRVLELEGPVFRAYIADKPGPQLLTVDGKGLILDNAVVIAWADLPEPVRKATATAVAGRLLICRRSIHRAEPTYVIDYLINEREPVFALIDAQGLVRNAIGYNQDDGDDDEAGKDETAKR